jgi:hypothetical protein
MRMSKALCAACQRKIDDTARTCPYCGANPVTGERVDTQTVLEEMFHPRDVSATESVIEYARQRQGIVIAVSILVALVALAALHQYVSARNTSTTTTSPAVPLTEVADLANQPHETPQPIPDLQYQFDGRSDSMRTMLVEPGAVAPQQPGQPAAAPAAPAPPAAAVPPARPR